LRGSSHCAHCWDCERSDLRSHDAECEERNGITRTKCPIEGKREANHKRVSRAVTARSAHTLHYSMYWAVAWLRTCAGQRRCQREFIEEESCSVRTIVFSDVRS
jgi:hypothetical protein